MNESFGRRAALTLALATGLIAAGCGGDDNPVADDASPEEVVQAFYDAAGDNDAAAACALASEETQQQAADAEDADSCEEGTSFGGDEGSALAQSIEVGDAQIDGDAATVDVSSEGGGSGTVDLVQEDGQWKIDFSE